MRPLLIAVLVSLLFAQNATAQTVESRPIDQATVRLLGFSGMERGSAVAGNVQRIVYAPKMSFGSGVLVADDLVATAAHVVENIDFLTVRLSGDQVLRGASVVAIDSTSDVALVRIQRVDRAPLAIPNPLPSLVPGEMLSTTGFPLDAEQLNPAAAVGALSRQTNDGLLELAVSLNPGNSGGPVLNVAGELVGIVSARGRMDRGIQGVGIAIPISRVTALLPNQQQVEVPTIPASIPWLFDDEAPSNEAHLTTPVLAALIAHREWLAVVNTLVEFRAAQLSQLPQNAQRRVAPHHRLALRALDVAFGEASQVERYKLEELRAQLSGVQMPQSLEETPQGVAHSMVSAELEVRVPPPFEPRLHLRFGMEVPLLGAAGRVTLLVDVLQLKHIELFTSVSFGGGLWFDTCSCFRRDDFGSIETVNDTTFVSLFAELGLRARSAQARPHVFGELGLGLEVFYAFGNEKTVVTPVRARLGFGVQISGKVAIIADYRFVSLGDFEELDRFFGSMETTHLNYHAFSLSGSLDF